MADTLYTPLPPPALPADFKQPDPLTQKHEEMLEKVLTHFSKTGYAIPGLDAEKCELMEEEKFWLSYECMLRYLRATKWKSADDAIHRIEDTLKWRREFGIYDLITPEHVEPEAVTGKEIMFGYDTSRRPACYMIPSRQNTTEPEDSNVPNPQIHFTVWILERAIDQMGPGVESVDLLINFADKPKNPSLGVAHKVLNILQNHYPERLGLALILNVPWLVDMFFKLIKPFIDPVTREKMRFNPKVIKDGIFTPDMVMSEWSDEGCKFEYKHETYWPALIKMCDELREQQMQKWKELGGTVGLKEWDIKNGQSASENGKAEVAADEAKEIVSA